MPELPWSCPYCAQEPRAHGDRTVSTGFDDGWRAAMKFAHHCHTRKDGVLDANGVVGAGPDCIIVDEDWLDAQIRRMEEAEHALAAITEERNEERRLRVAAEQAMDLHLFGRSDAVRRAVVAVEIHRRLDRVEKGTSGE